jgi:hypothetical protein
MKFYNKILNIQRKKTNKLKRKLNKLNKNLSLLCIDEKNNSENDNEDFSDKIYFINQIMNNLENFVEMINYEIKYKLNNKNKENKSIIENKRIIENNEKIKKLIDCDIESQEIIDKFLPLMLYYQLIKY